MSQNFSHGYALLIGVGKDLPVTVHDATVLRDILIDPQRCAYPVAQVKLLTETETTSSAMLEGLDWLAAQARNNPETTVVVYYSGHGYYLPDYHFLLHNYNSHDIPNTTVSGQVFTEKLRTIHARRLLVLLDCCHAGGLAEAKGAEKGPMPPQLNDILGAGSGRVVIASSRKNEVSWTGKPYSAFTGALVEGLAGYGAAEQDGFAYVADLAMYVSRRVPNLTQDKQHPILKLAGADNFAVAYYAGGEKTPNALPQNMTSSSAQLVTDLSERYRRLIAKYRDNLLTIEERIAEFYDQAAVPLDLERAREAVLKKIAELEQTAVSSHATPRLMTPNEQPRQLALDLLNRLMYSQVQEVAFRSNIPSHLIPQGVAPAQQMVAMVEFIEKRDGGRLGALLDTIYQVAPYLKNP